MSNMATLITRFALPGVGEAFEIRTASGADVIIVARPGGQRELFIRPEGADTPTATLLLEPPEVAAVLGVLIGSAIELTTTDALPPISPTGAPSSTAQQKA